jgi:hypothetical protein
MKYMNISGIMMYLSSKLNFHFILSIYKLSFVIFKLSQENVCIYIFILVCMAIHVEELDMFSTALGNRWIVHR